MDVEIESLEHWWELGMFITEQMEPPVLSQTYWEWRKEYPEGISAHAE